MNTAAHDLADTSGVVCRLCDPAATADDTAYCPRCVPDRAPQPPGPEHQPAPHTPQPVPPQWCAGCGRWTHLADGRCLLCRLAATDAQPQAAAPAA